jgi:GH25 family lysozyme M1 (1,4-beta-N-acetylmuramidase)
MAIKVLSQRNPEWFDIKIGDTNENLGGKGCLITCISMITDYVGKYLNPGELAQTLDFTPEVLLLWNSLPKGGLDFVYRFKNRDDLKIKKAFKDPDQFVVLQVNNNHWVWLIGVKGGYKVADPYYGDIIFLSKRKYRITGFAILEKQDEPDSTDPNNESDIITGVSPDFLSLPKGSKFVDLSHWNEIEDLSKTKSAGYKGAIHKCTQGIGFKDSAYITNKKRIRDINWCFGAYHFANAGNAESEAEWFIMNLGEIRNGDILVLDYETYARKDADEWCLRFMDCVREKLGLSKSRIILYTYHGILNKYGFKKVSDAGYKLWAARYGKQEQEPNKDYKPSTGEFDKFWAWQYTSMGEVQGIGKRVDLNVVG